ncbi:MAG: ParA family protein [Pseudomonadota bacterium]
MLTVLVANTKGGCGKTTAATHLASAFANAGLTTALADCDRQRSSLGWLKARPKRAARIRGIDWVKDEGDEAGKVDRLVIDAPAALRFGRIESLIKAADVIVVPLLPSVFDEQSTKKLLKRVDELKPIRKGKKPVGIVANRLKPRARATSRLESFVATLDHTLVGRIHDRAIYADVALDGLALFDLDGKRAVDLRGEWLDVVRFCESHHD